MGLSFNMLEVEYAPTWLLDKISREPSELIEKIATTLWGIWYARNLKIWEGKQLTPSIAMDMSVKQVKEWQEAMKRKNVVQSNPSNSVVSKNIKWTPPEQARFKMNVDASVFAGASAFNIGLIIRDDHGCFVQGKNMCFSGSVTVLEAEARGVQEAICWAEEMNMHYLVIETDSALVVEAMQSDITYYLEVGHILEFCKSKLQQRSDLSLCHVKKQANRAAHLMARVPCLLDSYNLFLSPPDLLVETLCSDASF
ncbi:uncharacterized protein LOC108221728 [Daucus carota subsp. sativus]|uniref:uncharacterized protein LOC108221728 n=1 Tax=Daucus carota subsp. sativus TaxID=79200 RepID=UPI0007EF8900|nr:PREDICTED: uncharacterized protein LOC108221728 [Daucus carota subsp. sativus]